ncbi:MAG: ATP-binding cassette domain-containing protein [Planctomycetota bacterium]
MPSAIAIEGVRKTFGEKVAVEGLDLTIPEGRLTGLIGPNGAGKTTSIRMIMSILFPDSGRLEVLGRRSALESKDRIGYLPEERGVYKKMKVWGFLQHMAALKGIKPDEARTRIGHWLEKVQLPDVGPKKCEELSKGMQQKIQFIASVIHEPDLLILDEPFSGLDPVNMRLLRELIREQHDRGTTVIFSTHVMHQAEQVCDHIVMIHQGQKVLDDSIASIRAGHEPTAIVFEPLDPQASIEPLERVEGVQGVAQVEGIYEAALAHGANGGEVMRRMLDAIPLARVELRRPTLEDVFIEIVSGGTGDAALRAELRGGSGNSETVEAGA